MANENNIQDNQLFITRVIYAPRQLVFKVWTDPEHMPLWWGPNGFTNTIHAMKASTGGFCEYTMHGPDGTDYPNYQSYKEIIPNEKIEYLHGTNADDVENGFHVVVNFENEQDATRINMLMTFESVEDKQLKIDGGAKHGLTEHINNMEDYLTFYEADSTFTISRVFDAPLQLLYEVHTQKEHIKHYWGPKESNTDVLEFDFQTGGRLFYCMNMPGGEFYGQQIFREIVPNRLITMLTSFCNEKGEAIRPPMDETLQLYMLNSMGFEAVDEHKTKLTIKAVPFNSSEEEHKAFKQLSESMRNGYGGTLDTLEAYLQTLKKTGMYKEPNNRTLTIERIYDAPRKLVWQAWTEPKHLAAWWGRGMDVNIEELDFQPGGKWKFSMPMPDGNIFISEGVYAEIVEMEKIVSSAEFKPMTEGIIFTALFEDEGDKTKFTFQVLHPTEEYRKQQEDMGFYNGWGSVFDSMGEHIASM